MKKTVAYQVGYNRSNFICTECADPLLNQYSTFPSVDPSGNVLVPVTNTDRVHGQYCSYCDNEITSEIRNERFVFA